MENYTRDKNILVVDDEEHILRLLEMNLRAEGYRCQCVTSGEEGLRLARRDLPDLIVLDVMLPGVDGITVCRRLKSDPRTRSIPVIMLSAKSEDQDTIVGLEGGADDYLGKPLRMKELKLRIRAALRQVELLRVPSTEFVHRFGSLLLDSERYQVTSRGERIDLTPTEFRILHLLMRYPEKEISRETMIREALDRDPELAGRTLDVHVRNIRKKIEEGAVSGCRIVTLRGKGYSLVGD